MFVYIVKLRPATLPPWRQFGCRQSDLRQAKRSLTVPSFKALAVLFYDLQKSGYVKQHNVALPLHPNCWTFILILKIVCISTVFSLTLPSGPG